MVPERRCGGFGSDKLPPLIGLVICWNGGGLAGERPDAHRSPRGRGWLRPWGGKTAGVHFVTSATIAGLQGRSDRQRRNGAHRGPELRRDLSPMLDRLRRRYPDVVRLELEAAGIPDVNPYARRCCRPCSTTAMCRCETFCPERDCYTGPTAARLDHEIGRKRFIEQGRAGKDRQTTTITRDSYRQAGWRTSGGAEFPGRWTRRRARADRRRNRRHNGGITSTRSHSD